MELSATIPRPEYNYCNTATKFTVNGVDYSREVFSSAPDQVIIIRLKASKAKALNFSVDVNHELRYEKVHFRLSTNWALRR